MQLYGNDLGGCRLGLRIFCINADCGTRYPMQARCATGMRDADPRGHRRAVLGWVPLLVALCAPLACEGGNVPRSTTNSSAATSPQPPPIASAERGPAHLEPSAPPLATAPPPTLYGASADTIEEALRRAGWTPVGSRVGLIKGVECITVLASREGMSAEVKSFYGYPDDLQDMLELKGTAQGFAEMTMITVLVKGDVARTDKLYQQLMGSAPMRHGSGLGLPQNRAGRR